MRRETDGFPVGHLTVHLTFLSLIGSVAVQFFLCLTLIPQSGSCSIHHHLGVDGRAAPSFVFQDEGVHQGILEISISMTKIDAAEMHLV